MAPPLPAHSFERPRAAHLQPRARYTIGLLTHGAGDPNSQAVWEGVQSVAREHDANVICFPGKPLRSPHGFEAQANVIYDLAGPENVDGLVIWSGALCHQVDVPVISHFCRRYLPLPMVTVGHPLVEGIPGVVLDNYQGMRDVVTHMVESHNLARIAFVRGPHLQPEAEQRYQAYLDVLAAHHIPVDPALIVEGNFKESGGTEAIRVLLDERRVQFDALVAASDNMALGAMRALQRRGVRVPADVAVAGFNDEVPGRFVTPPLTTTPFRSHEMARRATEMLLALLRGETVPERVLLSTRLLIRQSCGCPDPLVSEAAGAPLRTADRPLAAALDVRRRSILAGMAECWELPLESAPAALLERLLDAFAAEMAGRQPGAFLSALADALHDTVEADGDVSRWHSAISALERATLPYLRDRSAWLRADSLWEQARVMIGETGQRAQAYQAFQAQEETRTLASIGQALGNVISLHDLEQSLAQALPRLGVPSAHVSLYEGPPGARTDARLVVATDAAGPLPLEPGGRPFAARQLTPLGLPDGRRFDLVVEPLYYRDGQLGFAVFEAEPHLEETCAILAEHISGAIQRSALYRQAEQARQAAEEGRRLAEEANLLKSRFLSTVSHELRTPLSLIVGTIEMLLSGRDRRPDLPPAYQHDLESIRTSAQHLAHLIGDVLDLASSQAGELRLTCEPLRLDEALGQVTALGEALAREKGLAWQSDIPADLPLVWADRTRIQQVVLNLVGNAVKFTEQGYVRLWAEKGKQQVVVAVTDSGIGIPPDEQEFIFDEFRQSERVAQRGCGGMGLGLAISRRLVELHGGRIGVLSTGAEGAGSTFYFTLPTIEAGAATAPAQDRTATVLVLSERAGAGGRLARDLAARGFTVEAATLEGHPDWLAQIVASPPGAIVLDLDPASGRAWELMHLLRRNPATLDIPVVFYTLSGEKNQGSALAVDFLSKPVATGELARALARQGLVAAGEGNSCTILLVDDEPAILDLHARLLQNLAPTCRILKAADGREALELMARHRPDLVLLDLIMPVLDGFGVLEAMREREALRNIPVIVLTARILTGHDMARLQQGVAAVLSKGLFSGPEVLAQVTDALRRNRRLGSEAQRVVRQAMAYIHEHYAEPFSRAKLAQAIGLSDRYLTRCFHAETGITPVEYLNRYRISQARTLLERGDMSITQVALAVGFADPSYFARVFRAQVGVAPREYQRGERPSSEESRPPLAPEGEPR